MRSLGIFGLMVTHYSFVYDKQGRHEALEFFERVLAGRKRILGEETTHGGECSKAYERSEFLSPMPDAP